MEFYDNLLTGVQPVCNDATFSTEIRIMKTSGNRPLLITNVFILADLEHLQINRFGNLNNSETIKNCWNQFKTSIYCFLLYS